MRYFTFLYPNLRNPLCLFCLQQAAAQVLGAVWLSQQSKPRLPQWFLISHGSHNLLETLPSAYGQHFLSDLQVSLSRLGRPPAEVFWCAPFGWLFSGAALSQPKSRHPLQPWALCERRRRMVRGDRPTLACLYSVP